MTASSVRRTVAAAALLLAPAAGGAAEVAILKSAEVPMWRPALSALKERSPGHTFTEYDLMGDEDAARKIIAGLQGRAALVAVGPLAARVAREAAPDVPLVFCMVLEPEQLDLPGQPRVAGVVLGMPLKNQLAAFRLFNPRGSRIGIVYSPGELGAYVQQARVVAAQFKITLVERPLGSEEDLPAALGELLRGQAAVDAVWMLPDPILLWDDNRLLILEEAKKAGKPVYGFSASQIEEGALVSHGADLVSVGEQTALLLDRITGLQAGPTDQFLVPRAEIVINEAVARKLKIRLSKVALQAATRVVR